MISAEGNSKSREIEIKLNLSLSKKQKNPANGFPSVLLEKKKLKLCDAFVILL